MNANRSRRIILPQRFIDPLTIFQLDNVNMRNRSNSLISRRKYSDFFRIARNTVLSYMIFANPTSFMGVCIRFLQLLYS